MEQVLESLYRSHAQQCCEESHGGCVHKQQDQGSANDKGLENWRDVEKIVTYVKRPGRKSQLLSGYALDLEVERRFGTTCQVTEIFTKSTNRLLEILGGNVARDFYSLHSVFLDDGSQYYLYLAAIKL